VDQSIPENCWKCERPSPGFSRFRLAIRFMCFRDPPCIGCEDNHRHARRGRVFSFYTLLRRCPGSPQAVPSCRPTGIGSPSVSHHYVGPLSPLSSLAPASPPRESPKKHLLHFSLHRHSFSLRPVRGHSDFSLGIPYSLFSSLSPPARSFSEKDFRKPSLPVASFNSLPHLPFQPICRQDFPPKTGSCAISPRRVLPGTAAPTQRGAE